MIKDLLGSLGSWEINLRESTPAEVVDGLDYFGHIAVVRGPIDVVATGDAMLPGARYVGILRERSRDDAPKLGGVGMDAWLGDEDEKGAVFETPVVINGANFYDAITAVLPPAVQIGYVGAVTGTYTGTHQFETPRTALNTICAAFGAEWYVTGDAKLFAGKVEQLYDVTPNAIVVRHGAGVDLDLTALGGKFAVGTDVIDYSTRVALLGQSTDSGTLVTASADAPSVPYVDMFGNKVKRTRMISESGTTEGSAEARAALNLNRFNRQRKTLKVTADKYETSGNFVVGDYAYVYDPDSGIFDATREIVFRGETLFPDSVRVSGISYPVTAEHTVGFRRGNGTWIDLTPWVVWETGTNEITVGDLPKSLGGQGSNPVRDRADSAEVDRIAPMPPTNLYMNTLVVTNDAGAQFFYAVVGWDAPTFNTDGSALTDFSNYVMQYKLSTENAWQVVAGIPDDQISVQVLPGRNYDFKTASQDINGNTGPYSPVFSAQTATDNVPPPAPSDPIVTNYLGQLRIQWDGKTASGAAMPPDFNRVEVHVGLVSNFVPDDTTRIDTLVAGGISYGTAPYGATRWVKLVAFDNSKNKGPASAGVSGTTTQVVSADIVQGAIDAGKIADDAVTNTKLGLGAVTGLKIADFAVGTTKIADLAVSAGKIDNLAVGTAKIADAAISSAKIALLAVKTANIDDLAVNNAKIANMTVGKLTAGSLIADVTVASRFATALSGSRVEMNPAGLHAYAGTTRTFFVDASNGNVDILGTYRTSATNGRSVLITANLSGVGGTGNSVQQAGMIFPSTNTGTLRYGQLYDNGTALVLDSPSLSTNGPSGIPRLGASLAVHSEGIYAFTEGNSAINSGTEAFVITQQGYARLGRLDIFGRGIIQLAQDNWTVETAGTGGTSAYGYSNGAWLVGNKNAQYARVSGQGGTDAASWRLGSGANRVQGNTDGTWYIGHPNDQAMYSQGTELIIRGRQAGGNINISHVNGSSVQVWGGSQNASMGVNGAFAAYSKNFVIPHPLDEGKSLVHGSTESPVHGVEYWGKATVGKSGSVVVKLPRYFEALTFFEDRAVLLTPVGAPASLAASYPTDGKFTVTAKAGTEFFWNVKAGRSDTVFEVEPAAGKGVLSALPLPPEDSATV